MPISSSFIPPHLMAAVEEQRLENGETDKRDARDPSGFLSEILGAPVTVKLNSGTVFKGFLQSVDGYMNISLEQCKEYAYGKVVRSWGDAFVRGNNVTYISAGHD